MTLHNTNTIVIVSGLPRSGTSMMMQMLSNGGLTALTDDIRAQDISNPKGYFEYEKVKSLAQDAEWLHLAQGKVVKVIAQLVPFLPKQFNYKIIMMHRDIKEILSSQQKMLGKDTAVIPFALSDIFTKQLQQTEQFISYQSNMEVLPVQYKEVIESPLEQAQSIASFLGMALNIDSLMKSIDKDLYRNK
jgi:hypothetical protein